MNKFFAIALALIVALPGVTQAQTSGSDNAVLENASALLTRQQQRMDILEAGLKEVRGILENDLREIKMKVEQMQSSSSEAGSSQTADLNALRDQMEKLSDMLAMTNRRMERTLEIASDTEFRLLRLEKRMQTLLALGGDDAAAALVQQDTIGAGQAAAVQMSRDVDTGISSWSVEEGALNDALAVVESDNATNAPSATAPADDNAAPAGLADKQDNAASNGAALTSADAGEAPNVPAQPEVLPAVSPEEQYRFALGRALQNDLETAQLAFSEFRKFNKGHEREADSIFWLGRVYFMRGEFEKAAMTFSEFNSAFPGDARLVDTTMWIAESVSHFAPPAQACEIYASLPQLIDTPPDTFLAQLSKLSDDANCQN
ncbi:MAG: tetratricopeptide repeat protein [Candidatus Puniceispirillaceae bacterium]